VPSISLLTPWNHRDRPKCCQAPSPVQNPSTILKPNKIKNSPAWQMSYGPLGILEVVSKK